MATILLVDDSDSVRVLLAAALTAAGHQVVSAGDGRRALQYVKARTFDVIVTDIYMPEADGLELITALSRMDVRPPIVAMSAVAGPMDMLFFARSLGAKVTMRKPFPPAELLQHIRTLVPTPAQS